MPHLSCKVPSDLQLEYSLTNKKSSWSTSTAVAHPFPHNSVLRSSAVSPCTKNATRPGNAALVPLPNKWKLNEDILERLRKEDLTTTNQLKYVCDHKPDGRIICSAPSCERIQYMKTFLEHPHRRLLPYPIKSYNSEHREEFSAKMADVPKPWELSGLMDVQKFNPKKIEASEGPFFSTVDGGAAVYLDPYATTSHLTHRPFSKYERYGVLYENAVGSFHDTYEVKKMASDLKNVLPSIPVRLYPVYDSLVFPCKATIRVLPRKTSAVPNRGLLTETQEQYRLR